MVKRRRNNELLEVQDAISYDDNQPLIGRLFEVLVEGPSKTSVRHGETGDTLQLTGRTPCDRIVVFTGNRRQIGKLLEVTIYDADAFTLFGAVPTSEVGPEVFTLSPAAMPVRA